MTQYQITLDETLLHQLFIGDSRDVGVAALLETVLNQVLKAQASEQLNAEHYERTEERRGYRNGTYPHTLTTRVGKLTLSVPRFRDGAFSTELFARYQRSEQALVLALMEMVINGVSTRKVTQVTEELCGAEFSKSTVSELCKKLDPVVQEWAQRTLTGKEYPFLLVDAMYVKVREDGRVRSRGVMIATGINDSGLREILGLQIGDTESEASWGSFFAELKQRGLHGVDVVTSDQHGGLVKAIRTHFQGVTWQRCQTHCMRNILEAAPKALRPEIKAHVRAIFDAANEQISRDLLKKITDTFAQTAPKAMQILEDGFDDATAVLALPAEVRVRTRTTNAVERLNKELRRRERVIGIFPNRESVFRLFGSLLMEQADKWCTERQYLDFDAYNAWRKSNSNEQSD